MVDVALAAVVVGPLREEPAEVETAHSN